MKILIIHQNFPGQFKFLAPKLSSMGHEVTALIPTQAKTEFWQGIRLEQYHITRPNTPNIHPLALDLESKVIRGEACLKTAIEMKRKGYSPDIILAHPGWGESLFLKDLWPVTELKLYCEFYYHGNGYDYDFDIEFAKHSPLDAGRAHLKNANFLLQWDRANSGITPTNWQFSSFPAHVRKNLSVIHDGINCTMLRPIQDQTLKIGDLTLTKKDEVITFVNRNLEPYRGFHIFMRSLPEILKRRPNTRVVIIGGTGVSYGEAPKRNDSWKTKFTNEIYPLLKKSERDRIHFTGAIPYNDYISALQISTVHVYLTYPFILSWSLIEAMSCGCAIVGSKTRPVEEVITHGETGLLVDFFGVDGLSKAVVELLADEESRRELSERARRTAVSNYDLEKVCLPKQIDWVLGDKL